MGAFIFKSNRSQGQKSQGIETTCSEVKEEGLAKKMVLAASRRGTNGTWPWNQQGRESTTREGAGRPARDKFKYKELQ